MNRGFIFSIDALFAIGIVLATLVFVTTYASPPAEEQFFDLARLRAGDEAITRYYLGQNPSMTAIPDGTTQGYCFQTHYHALYLDSDAEVDFDSGYNDTKGCAVR